MAHELEPQWVIVENVASGAGKWVDVIRGGLELIGYETIPIPLSAHDVGAPHLRRRVFVIGRAIDTWSLRRWRSGGAHTFSHSNGHGESTCPVNAEVAGMSSFASDSKRKRVRNESEWLPGRRAGRIRGEGKAELGDDGSAGTMADTVGPEWRQGKSSRRPSQQGETPGRQKSAGVIGERWEDVANPASPGRADIQGGSEGAKRSRIRTPCSSSGGNSESRMGNRSHGISPWLDGSWEQGIPRTAIGVPGRVARLRALGNAVVPQCAQVIGEIIKELMG
jgi:DNA (cytosine-5)-methyltransferase 1